MEKSALAWDNHGIGSVLRFGLVLLVGLVVGEASTRAQSSKPGGAPAASAEVTGQEIAVLTDAPLVPPPIKRDHPTKVIVNLEVREVVQRLADGVDYVFWTFEGRGDHQADPGDCYHDQRNPGGERQARVHADLCRLSSDEWPGLAAGLSTTRGF